MRNFRMSAGLLLVLLPWSSQAREARGAIGARQVKRACDRAANWLIERHNLKDGTFGNSKYARLPALSALVLTGLCESPRRYRERLGPFISEPVKYLLKCQQPNGAVLVKDFGRDTYSTALAIQALVATRNREHLASVERAKEYLLKCRAKDGGFTYGYGFRQGGDLSNTWLALTAFHAYPQKTDAKILQAALGFIRRCQDNPETNPGLAAGQGLGSGGAYYQPGRSEAGKVKTREGREVPKPYGSMTAAAIESYLICGLKPAAPEVRAALRWFSKNFSVKENPGAGQAGYFYYTLAFSRAMTALGVKQLTLANGKKVNWAEALGGRLLSIQKRPGWFVNSEPRWMEGDKVLCTAYALQTLDLCYRALK